MAGWEAARNLADGRTVVETITGFIPATGKLPLLSGVAEKKVPWS